MGKRVEDEVLRELAVLYDTGMSIIEVARSTHRSQRVVRRAIKMFGTHRPSNVGKNSTSKFKRLDSESAYWLGFIAADGHIRFKPDIHRYELVVELKPSDEGHIDKLKDFIGFGSKFYRKRSDGCVILSAASKELVLNITEWLPANNKTDKDMISKIPGEFKRDFIRGYFDGDGHAGINMFSITSCPESLSPIIEYIYDVVGEAPRVYQKKGGRAISANWNKQATLAFRREFDGYPRLERKWNK